MKILFEGQRYNVAELIASFGDKFYHRYAQDGFINVVGYYHGENSELFYFLPKLFVGENECFLDTDIHYSLFFQNPIEEQLVAHLDLLNWFRKFLLLFYKSLANYKRRVDSSIIELGETLQLSSSVGKNEYTFLDIVLSILNFYKKNKDVLIFHQKRIQSKKHHKVNWNKTISKYKPLIINGDPLYTDVTKKKRQINQDEELMVYFYSVLNYLKEEYKVDIAFTCPYNLIRGARFKDLLENGIYKLKILRNNYFSDQLKAIYNLLELFFQKTCIGQIRNRTDDFIIVRNYYTVFEDMIDRLISDELQNVKTSNGQSLNKLKNNPDGKVIDHLFEFDNLIDDDESIFYIGDSKYYKHNNEVSSNSVYKQFTYAKNVIQFNIDLLLEKATMPSVIKKNIRYRDNITDGYNISPNFFIQGIISDYKNFDNPYLSQNKDKNTQKSSHFKERLFDRDTLFVNYYEINFLFVLNAYSNFSDSKILELRNEFKLIFKTHFKTYFKNHSGFDFYQFKFESEQKLIEFVNLEFAFLTGRMMRTSSDPARLIIAFNARIDKKLQERFSIVNNLVKKAKEYIYVTDCSSEFIIEEFNF